MVDKLKYLVIPAALLAFAAGVFTGCQNSGGSFAANEEALYLFDDGTTDIPQEAESYDYAAASGPVTFAEEETVSYAATTSSTASTQQSAGNDTQYYSADAEPTPQIRRASASPSYSGSSSSGGGGSSSYTVRRGDSLYKIARAHGMSVDRLKSLNGLNSNLIHPGEKLRVSGSASTRTASASRGSSSGGSYTVRGGDTLWGISRKHGISVTSLKNANGLSSNTIQPGQRLTIP